jgi:hypothetical protein
MQNHHATPVITSSIRAKDALLSIVIAVILFLVALMSHV